VLVEARVFDQGAADRLVAIGTANHAVLVPQGGAPMPEPTYGLVLRQGEPSEGTPRPDLAEHFGVRRTPNGAVLDMDARTRNPWGILHGALYVLLAEEAAPSWQLEDLDVRFVAPVRTGPAVASAELVDSGTEDRSAVLRVEVRDGPYGRLCGLLMASARPK
jgi:hypothetical protein